MNQKAPNNTRSWLNPNNKSYWTSRGYPDRPSNWTELIDENEFVSLANRKTLDNRANRRNPNHIAYWKSRGYDTRPFQWRVIVKGDPCHDDVGTSGKKSGGHATGSSNQRGERASTATVQEESATTWGAVAGGFLAGAAAVGLAAAAIGAALSNDVEEKKGRSRRRGNKT